MSVIIPFMIEVPLGEVASYTASGVDIRAGDELSDMWHEAARRTYDNRSDRLGQIAVLGGGSFGVRGFDLDLIQGQRGLILVGGVDGVGTKPELSERLTSRHLARNIQVEEEFRDHSGIFIDLLAMITDDIARDGGEPFGVATLFDANTLSDKRTAEVVRQLCLGAIAGCKTAEVVYFNGETAELGQRVGGYGPFNYNLGGFALGAAHRDRVLTGEHVRPGDKIVALREHGFRANGMSLVRKVMRTKFGSMWHFEQPEFAEQALKPSIIYTPTFVDLHGGYNLNREPKADISAIVHVTGGGIPGKLQRKLAVTGRGAVLEDLFDPPDAMLQLQEWSMSRRALATPDWGMYQSLNGGIGALVITRVPETVQGVATVHGVESKVVGEIVSEPGILLKSHGVTDPGEWIHFVPQAA